MSRFMRLLVLFDLPVVTKAERKAATKFRNFLLKDGYMMLQYSVYCRICTDYDMVKKHEKRLSASLPPNGLVQCLVVTEKQFESSKILVGKLAPNFQKSNTEQLTLF